MVSELVIKHLSSSALGSNELRMVPMVGRYVFDLFQDVKREHKLESYSLNNVSKHFLKEQKFDMPVKEIFGRYVLIGQGVALSLRYSTGKTEVVDISDPTAGFLIPVRWRQGGG